VERKTSGSWMTTISLGFTVLVLTTGYTAVVTTTLVQESMAAVSSLSQAAAAGYTFCTEPGVEATMANRYPEIANKLVAVSNDMGQTGILDAMDSGRCRAAILVDFQWYTGRLDGSVHCGTKIRLLETLLSVPVGMPVADAILRPVAALIQIEVGANGFAPFVEQGKANYTTNPCLDAGNANAEVTQFTLESMSGPLILMVLVSTISMIVTRLGQRAQARAERLKASLDTDNDGIVSKHELRQATRKRATVLREASSRGLRRSPSKSTPQPALAPPLSAPLPAHAGQEAVTPTAVSLDA